VVVTATPFRPGAVLPAMIAMFNGAMVFAFCEER
jgi:hypothetical protein